MQSEQLYDDEISVSMMWYLMLVHQIWGLMRTLTWKTLALCWIASAAAKTVFLATTGSLWDEAASRWKWHSTATAKEPFFPLNLLIPSVCFYSLFKNIMKSFLLWKFSNIYKIEIIMWTLMYSSPCFNNFWKFCCVASFISL